MPHKLHNIGVSARIGNYSDAVESAPNLRWLHTSGTPGLLDGRNLPTDITGQAARAWEHILEILRHADMSVDDIVKVSQYLIRPEDVPAYVKVRSSFLGDARPAFLLLVVPQLIWPEVLVEVEVIAAKAVRSI
jgi:enamine deaminase RidA (YjgF/YER057c/UK114 family)